MTAYLVGRTLQMFVVMFVVTAILFFVMRLLPGDPILALVGEAESGFDDETVEKLREELGLNDSVIVQYGRWLTDALQGDLGRSARTRLPVSEQIVDRFPVTAQLGALSLVLAISIGVTTGTIAALKRNSLLDIGATMVAMFGIAVPNFWFAILLIWLFVVYLGWLPPAGFVGLWEDPVSAIEHMILPVTALGLTLSAAIMRHTRSDLLEVLNQDYVRTARAKGLSGRTVVVRHALRNSLLPVVTVIGLQLGGLLGGSVIIESMFGLPGLGRLAVQSINARDYPTLQGVVLLFTVITLVVNLATDLSYAIIDPRVRFS